MYIVINSPMLGCLIKHGHPKSGLKQVLDSQESALIKLI